MEQRGLEHADDSRGGGLRHWLARNTLSAAGYVVLLIHLGALMVTVTGWPGMSSHSLHSWSNAQATATPLTLCVSSLLLWIGEFIRRQRPPVTSYAGTHSQGWIPRTTHLRMLTLRWHVLWSTLAVIVAVVLLWFSHLDPSGPGWAIVTLNGALLAAVAGAFAASGFKKHAWFRSGMAQQRVLKDTFYKSPQRSRHLKRAKFWSWFSARFFVDLWCVGVGFALWWFAAWLIVTDDAFAGELDATLIAALIVSVTGAGLVAFGLWATTQFWRSGVDLATGESLG